MDKRMRYIIIFSILLMFLAVTSVATAQEVNAATVTKQSLMDFGQTQLTRSQQFNDLADNQINEINKNEKKIKDTRKTIKSYDKQLSDKNKALKTKNKQLTSKNKQFKTYNNKLKKLNKKRKTKTVKKTITKTKKTISTLKKQISSYKKQIKSLKKQISSIKDKTKKSKTTLQTCIKLNTTSNQIAKMYINEAWKSLDYASWALDIFNNYDEYVSLPYDDSFDYGYYWQYPQAAQNNWYKYAPGFVAV
ncbi:MAG: hypothetical protein LBM96_02220 [Methanobrevibacter sp.]|jgi:chromosome segregation ATPase|nr:hypothetical protein [Candidatus Methanoflexus mossambicus]